MSHNLPENSELVRNNQGICSLVGDKVVVRDYKNKTLCECSVEQFLALVPMINAVFDKSSGKREIRVKEE